MQHHSLATPPHSPLTHLDTHTQRGSVLEHTTCQSGTFRHRIKNQSTADRAVADNYINEGNEEMYEEDMLVRRGNLRHHRDIVATINKFWDLFPSKDPLKGLKKHDYVNLLLCCCKVLDGSFKETSARNVVNGEWARDSYRGGMNKNQFFESIFELVDVWTETCEASEYVDFLSRLFKNITLRVAVARKGGTQVTYKLRALDAVKQNTAATDDADTKATSASSSSEKGDSVKRPATAAERVEARATAAKAQAKAAAVAAAAAKGKKKDKAKGKTGLDTRYVVQL
jgi:hypothetical protein